MPFKKFLLHHNILKAVNDAKYTIPTPIQEEAIPKILENCDIFASAQTGTGKTAAFVLPALNKLMTPSPIKAKGPRILVVVPTRELAMQVANECVKFSKYIKRAKTVSIFGGVPYPPQRKNLSRPYDILIATPGRLIDHLDQGKIDLSRVEMLVLDEADRMLDMGFITPVKHIAKLTPQNRQTLMFSATLDKNVLKLSKQLLKEPKTINLSPKEITGENIDQQLHKVSSLQHKTLLLEHILKEEEIRQAIIFTATKSFADILVSKLIKKGHYVAALHGDIRQSRRMKTIGQFRRNRLNLLVATDVAARGLDIVNVSHVINFDLPRQKEDYVHRIGRTGRAGAPGIAISFAAKKDHGMVNEIEKYLGKKMTLVKISDIAPREKMEKILQKKRIKTRSKPKNNSFKFHKKKRPFNKRKKPSSKK